MSTAVKKNQRNGINTQAPNVKAPQTRPDIAKKDAKSVSLEERIQKWTVEIIDRKAA
ncbi:MAG: hypothetical protein H6551_09955 [Chitinophagales bacterium]|nr:hypothetical protein [Chitinophagales bacterium]